MTSVSHAPVPRVLSIAGTDPSGGAGTAADLKSITAAGGYGMTVVTSLVAQNTHGVRAIHTPAPRFLREQLLAVSDDVEIDAVKTGMLGTVDNIQTVSEWLDANPPRVLVVDPVMVATSGDRLLDSEAEQAMVEFCRRATVVTPNIAELARLTGNPPAADEAEALRQAAAWAGAVGVAVVVKTGHLASSRVTNTWVSPDGTRIPVPATRLDTDSTHGTGCSLAAALATRLGRGDDPAAALAWATAWLHEAIAHGHALAVGSGHGPVDHSHRSRRLQAAAASNPWLDDDAVAPALHRPDDLAPDLPDGEPDPAVEPVGPWTRALWRAGQPTAEAIAASGFVRSLVDGSLPEEAFMFYLSQDALYLGRYSRALATLSVAADRPDAREFWAGSAQTALAAETGMHRTWLGDRAGRAMGPVTRSYTDFLLATTLGEPHPVGVAAVLPCYWLYAQTGATLPHVPEDHPYARWLGTYRAPGFVDSVRTALVHVERALATADPTTRAEAARAYLIACRHELEFFEQALRLEPTPPREQAPARRELATAGTVAP
ncbi:bifunctional hydroxymethylpyrimidine kinase/phosphomethylpyrimidine kinase [Tessaracoccus terricola]